MDNRKEELLTKMVNKIEPASNKYLNKKNFGNYTVENIIYYNKEVELTNIKTGKKEKFKLYVVITENKKSEKAKDSIFEIEFFEDDKGNILTIEELIKEHKKEDFKNIKDVVDATEENEKLPENKQNKEYKKEELNKLKEEKSKEQENKKEDKNKEQKESLTGKKPTGVLQTINVDKTYIDNWTTVSRGFDLPPNVKQLAIARPMKGDKNSLSSDMTIYMLDNKGNIIENVNGKTIKNYFKIDNATGKNPMYDDNTKLELSGHAEKNIGQTMRRFKSKEDTDLYLSIEQKRVGGYHELYVGGKTLNGNDPVEVQLETRNVRIQTDLEMQKVISRYKGIYNKDKMDKESDIHKEHGDDERKMPIENVDGKETTIIFKCKYIPGTDKTWEELSEDTGENIEELQERFLKELSEGKKPENIVKEIEYDYERIGPNRERI